MPFPRLTFSDQACGVVYQYYNPAHLQMPLSIPPSYIPMARPRAPPQVLAPPPELPNVVAVEPASLTHPAPLESARPLSPLAQGQDRAAATLDLTSDKTEICKILSNYTTSKYRYVYKCIVRHMNVYIRKNREDIVETLTKEGFSMRDIEHSFFIVSYHSDSVGKKGCDRTSLTIVNNMLAKVTIYTYILRETLYTILNTWSNGNIGKVSKKNIELYKNACQIFYDETVKALGKPAQGRNSVL